METFDDLAHRDTLAVLAKAPTPALGARLTLPQIRAALKRGGRQRNIDVVARRIQAGLRTSHLTAPEPVEDAFGTIVASLVKIVVETNRQIDDLDTALGDCFRKHPDADIYLSMPGLGAVLSARALAECSRCDPDRYTSAKSRRNYAGTSPITVASGRKHTVIARHVRNKRLYDALDQWGVHFPTEQSRRQSLLRPTESSRRRTPPSTPSPSQPTRILHGCLKHRTPYDEHTAWAHRTVLDRAAA